MVTLFQEKSVKSNFTHPNPITHFILLSPETNHVDKIEIHSVLSYAVVHDLMNIYFGSVISAGTVHEDWSMIV
ncbi:MAG: hypothetical protein WCL02_03975 [bacterium]